MAKFLLLFGLLFVGFQVKAQHFNRYCNAAFPFCVDVPGIFNRTSESPIGNGQFFTSKDGSTLQVYGIFNTDNENLQQRLNREQAALASDTTISNFTQSPLLSQANNQENSYSINYQKQDFTYLIYRKLQNNNWLCLELKSPTTKMKDHDALMQRMIMSFK